MGAQGPQFDADKTVCLHVVSDPAADNRLRFGPACRALDVPRSSTRSRPGARCFAITERTSEADELFPSVNYLTLSTDP
jgi:hypothetical protein